MKTSTRYIIGIIAAAAVAMTALSVYTICTAFVPGDYTISDANPVRIELQPFKRVDIRTVNPQLAHIRPYKFKGVVIEESDSVTVPELRTSLDWSRIITPEVKDSTLTLTFDFQVLSDTLNIPEDRYFFVECGSEKPVKLLVPRRTVREASTNQYNIYFDKFDGGTITADVFRADTYAGDYGIYKYYDRYPGWLMVNEGRLDTIICTSPLEGLRLYKATVGEAHVPMSDIHFTVVSKQPGDSVRRLFVSPVDSIYKSGELDLQKARIGTLYMPPRDSVNFTLNLSINRPIDIRSASAGAETED